MKNRGTCCLKSVLIRKDQREFVFAKIYVGWLVVSGLAALSGSISVYIGPSPKEREKEERNDRREKNVQTKHHPHLVQAQ